MPAIPPKPKSTADDRNLVVVDENYVAPGLEDKLRLFWEKNSRLVLAAVALVALVIVGRGAMDFFAEQHEKSIAADYAALTSDSQLKAFIAEHPDHPLAGLAQLHLADAAYVAGNYAEAQAGYAKALPLLAGTPLAARAQLGAAVAGLQTGHAAEAAAALKRLADDPAQLKAVRVEAAYDLAALAAEAGRADEVARLTAQIVPLAPENSPWVERAHELQLRLSAATAPPATGKTDAAPPSVIFKPQ